MIYRTLHRTLITEHHEHQKKLTCDPSSTCSDHFGMCMFSVPWLLWYSTVSSLLPDTSIACLRAGSLRQKSDLTRPKFGITTQSCISHTFSGAVNTTCSLDAVPCSLNKKDSRSHIFHLVYIYLLLVLGFLLYSFGLVLLNSIITFRLKACRVQQSSYAHGTSYHYFTDNFTQRRINAQLFGGTVTL